MKVTNNERFVFGILEIAMVVRDTLEYFVPTRDPNGYDVKKYNARKEIIKLMTSEKSPFVNFCKQNGLGNVKDPKTGKEVPARGQRLLNIVNDFSNLVYGDDPRFVRIVDGKITIDSSYFVPVLENVIGLRETLNDVIAVIIKNVKVQAPAEIDPTFEDLITTEQRYARAIELRINAMQLNTTFLRFNNAVKKYIQTLRSSTSIDPLSDPNFKPTDDPEVAFDNNEMGRLFGFMNFLINHSKETDDEFKNAAERMRTMSKGFAGQPKITNLESFMSEFAGIFIPIIKETGAKLQPLFSDSFNSIRAYEQELRAKNGQSAPEAGQVAAAPVSETDKVAAALSSPSETNVADEVKKEDSTKADK